jgi:HPr kinase/phosphorylase
MALFNAQALLDAFQDVLELKHLAGRLNYAENETQDDKVLSDQAYTIGYLNLIRPNLVQVIEKPELIHLQNLAKDPRNAALKKLFTPPTRIVLLTGDLPPPPRFLDLAERSGIPLLSSPVSGQALINLIAAYVNERLMQKISRHGVSLEVLGTGILITGAAGIGKSELALELINRGHRLIADDITELTRMTADTIVLSCPEGLRDHLEVRGLGIINVRAMFGDNVVCNRRRLRLIIQLVPLNPELDQSIDRLHGSRESETLNGVKIPKMLLPVAPGRNLSVMVEAAIRNLALRQRGEDAVSSFIAQQQAIMRRDSE